MASKKMMNGESTNGHVSISREEYEALIHLRDESAVQVAVATNRSHDLVATCNAQSRRLAESDLAIQHYERVVALQRAYIDLLRGDYPKVASLEDLSEFWRQWTICTLNLIKEQPQQRDAVAQLTPDLFKSWGLWVRDGGRQYRSFSVAGTRAGLDGARSTSQADLQDSIVEQLREKNALLAARIHELEGEVDAYKNGSKRKGV